MNVKRFSSYKAYTVGCVIAWGILWIVVGTQSSHTTREHVLYVFLGWLLGWTSATIARAVYPPPAKHP
jgi:4-hydroxybenzoate polyprenyltransferase